MRLRLCLRVLPLAALLSGMALAVGCMGGGGADEEEAGRTSGAAGTTGSAETGPDVALLREEWAQAADAACAARDEAIAGITRALPDTVEQEGLAGASSGLADVTRPAIVALDDANPAPGDEEAAARMIELYTETLTLEAKALGSAYKKEDRRFYALMGEAEETREEADSLAGDLGATRCTEHAAGPYADVDGLAAVRWGAQASEFCRERDKAFGRLRPTDLSGFEAASTRWLRQMRLLATPKQYAREIERFLDMYAQSSQASRRGAIEEANRLVRKSTELMYDVGFTIGFDRFCSARPE